MLIGHRLSVQSRLGGISGYAESSVCWWWAVFSPVLATSPSCASCTPALLHSGLPTPLPLGLTASLYVDLPSPEQMAHTLDFLEGGTEDSRLVGSTS